jgi:luciferase-type oxidoreductase
MESLGEQTLDLVDPQHHAGFASMFRPSRLRLGVFFPIEAFLGSAPRMENQVALARRAEVLGFSALWFRDVPLLDPTFGDIGQIYDPWTYLGYIAAQTDRIALATGSIVLSLRHPLHVAKAAASIDKLSGERLVMGVATGDRPIEFPAFGRDFEARGARFRESVDLLRTLWAREFPTVNGHGVRLDGDADLLPKPRCGAVPLLVTGRAQQSLDWIARHGDGWLSYPRDLVSQAAAVASWQAAQRAVNDRSDKPFAQSLYVDLTEAPNESPRPIHLGYRIGREGLLELLEKLLRIGVSHVALNLKYGRRPAPEVLEELGAEVVPRLASL